MKSYGVDYIRGDGGQLVEREQRIPIEQWMESEPDCPACGSEFVHMNLKPGKPVLSCDNCDSFSDQKVGL